MAVTVLTGDCRQVLATLAPGSAQTCVTSPPYFGLRDYGVDGQIGLEATVEGYVAELVAVFREVRRVLADDGTCWLNLGDSYAANWNSQRESGGGGFKENDRERLTRTPGFMPKQLIGIPWRVAFALQADGWWLRSDIIWHKPNPMPESVTDRPTKAHEYIFLLTKRERYYYDADAIAEPVTQTTVARVSQPNLDAQHGSDRVPGKSNGPMKAVVRKQDGTGNRTYTGFNDRYFSEDWPPTRNARTVWTVTTKPFSGAHFATFPPDLIVPCVKAGSLPLGAYEPDDLILTPIGSGERGDDPSMTTGRAGMNRPRREHEAVRPISRAEHEVYAGQMRHSPHRASMCEEAGGDTTFGHYLRTDRSGARPVPPHLLEAWIDRGWLDRVDIPPRLADPSRSTVLDPFGGAGTTGLVADRLGRHATLIELNPEYADMARRRITNDAPLFAEVG